MGTATSDADRRLRVAQVALLLNAAAHGAASVGMALGLDPHAALEPVMARRAAAAGFAAVVMLGFVARRLRSQPSLIVLPMAFVVCNLAASLIALLGHGDRASLAPALFEATFLAIYAVFAARRPTAAPAA